MHPWLLGEKHQEHVQHYHTMTSTTVSLHAESNIQPQISSNRQCYYHLDVAFGDTSIASIAGHIHHCHMDVSWKAWAALLVAVIAASIAAVVAAVVVIGLAVTVESIEGFAGAAAAAASISAAELRLVFVDDDPGTAWGPVSEESVALLAAAIYPPALYPAGVSFVDGTYYLHPARKNQVLVHPPGVKPGQFETLAKT